MCDKKKSDLITVPVRVTNLVDTEKIDVKFPAPRKPGMYTYTMCLKSDSYLDMDLTQNLKVSDVITVILIDIDSPSPLYHP